MDLAWLSPSIATALAAAIAVTGTLVGVFLRGEFDAKLLHRQLAQAERQLQQQQQLHSAQLELQREQFNAQFTLQQLEASRTRAEARAATSLSLRRESYAALLKAMNRAIDGTWNWWFECNRLAEAHPDRDWDSTPHRIDDPSGLVAMANAPRLSEMSRVFESMDGQATNPAWIDAGAAISAGHEFLSSLQEWRELEAQLELFAPTRVLEAGKAPSIWVIKKPERPDNVHEFRQDLTERRRRFLQAAREDLGSEVSLDLPDHS